MDYSVIIETLRKSFADGVLRDIASRKEAIRAIYNLVNENAEAIIDACAKDLHRPKAETSVSDVGSLKLEAILMLNNMDKWLKDEYVPRSFISIMDTPYVQRQPLGTVFIIGSWNYPILLLLSPLIGAIAAGNTAVIKPSEYSPNCADLLKRLIPKYLNQNICQVICTDAKGCAELLASHRFDHVMYTGGVNGGRAVYTAAAKFLTPVTLELGGKCPSYVDSGVNMLMTVKRITWTKLFNAGQTCVAPDYVLCHRDSLHEFRTTIPAVIREFLGDDPHQSPDFARIINTMHFKRLTKLLADSKGKILCGGQSNEDDLYIAPTVVDEVTLEDSLMSEEIFGPILPIITVNSASEAVDIIHQGEKPLAIYVFTNDNNVFDLFKHNTSSGALLQNDCACHGLEHNLPLGGVGNSGLGRYHGKYSIDTFSHQRSILLKTTKEFINNRVLYPPYNETKISRAQWLLSGTEGNKCSIM